MEKFLADLTDVDRDINFIKLTTGARPVKEFLEEWGYGPYTHMTFLAIMMGFRPKQVLDFFLKMVAYGIITMVVTGYADFGTPERPNWVLLLAPKPGTADELFDIFSLLDSEAAKERNGVLYRYRPEPGSDATEKQSHMSLGNVDPAKLPPIGTEIEFDRIFAKPLGPYDGVTIELARP